MRNSYLTYGGKITKDDMYNFSGDASTGYTMTIPKTVPSYKIVPVQFGSGFLGGFNGWDISQQYAPLPKEYANFSSFDGSILELANENQRQLISICLEHLRRRLIELMQYGIVRVLPKLIAKVDQDNAIVLNWVHVNFRIYFNFEQSIENSYYGVISQDGSGGISTKTGKLNEDNYVGIIDAILAYVIDNS